MPPDTNITVPTVREDYRFGMDSLNPPKKLPAHVQQLLENSYPGMTLKPLNGVKDAFVSTVQLGYGTKDSYFQQRGVYVEAGGKEFFFAWHQNATTSDEYALEIWNLTDDSRTKLIYGDYDQSIVYFNMEKLYDAVYITMNYEMATNHVSAYRTKNKIVEWDSAASAWIVREMGIDIAGSFEELSIEDMSQTWGARASHEIVFFNDRLWMGGGANGTTEFPGLLYSIDGVTWVQAIEPNTAPFDDRLSFGFLVYDNKLWVIGGSTFGTSYKNDVWYSSDGLTWIEATASAAFSGRYGLGVCVYNNLMWVISGRTGAASYADDVYSSSDGITWTLVKTGAAFTACSVMGVMVYDNKMWMTGGYTGSYIDEVYSSEDGETWTEATATAEFGNRGAHSVAVHRGKMWVIHGFSGAFYTNVYSSTDGATWTEETTDTGIAERAFSASSIFKNKIWLWGGLGDGSTYYNDSYASSDGIVWSSQDGGLTPDLYRSYASTYVRRTDAVSKLASMDDYEYSIWETFRGLTVVSVDEKLLTGTVSLTTTALTGVGTAFDTQLVANDYIRIDGKYAKYKITSVTDATNAVVVNANSDTHTTKEFSLLPLVGDSITTDNFLVGTLEGVEDIEKRQTIYMTPPSTTNGRVFIRVSDITDPYAQGATHLRVWRGLGNSDLSTAEGLTHRYLVDIALSGQGFTQIKVYRDKTTDNALDGETNFLSMTGFSVPPLGRYMIWANNLLWIGGVPDENGKWFHSVVPGTAGVAFNVRFPQKYASMFDLDEDFVTCDPQDGQRDTGIGWLHGDLYLFKERKIFVVYGGNPNNVPVRISRTIGCACPESIENGDIPNHGEVLFFESDSGPAYITSGGKVVLFTAFTIAELWPKNTGVLTRSNGTPTDWYTRNRVVSRFWNNTWWIFYGDSRDGTNQISGNKVFGYNFSTDGQSIGPFEWKRDYKLAHTIYEPKMLMPVDNNRAYTLSHCLDAAGNIHYRLTQFLDPAIWRDIFDEVTLAYKLVWQTRYIFAGPKGTEKRKPKKVILFIDFEDDEELKITINVDGSRQTASKVYSQTRQSGLSNSGADTYRAFIVMICKEDLRAGNFFDIKVEKVVPSTGVVEVFAQEIELYPVTQTEDEFYDTFDDATGSTTFVVKADASPEVEA